MFYTVDDAENGEERDVIFPQRQGSRNKRKNIMLCIPYEERRLTESRFGWSFPVIVQPKLDGHRAIAIRNASGEYLLYTSEGNEVNLPHLEDGLSDLSKINGLPYSLDGEIYTHGLSFEEISSLIKSPRHRSNILCFHAFDLYTPNTSDPFFMRAKILSQHFERVRTRKAECIRCVPTYLAYSLEDINEAMARCVAEGYEGIVIRHYRGLYETKRSTFLMKYKPKQQDTYEILSVSEAFGVDGDPLSMVGSFLVKPTDAGIAYTFSVSAGTITHVERKRLWLQKSELVGKMLLVSYQTQTAKGIPRAAFAIKVLKDGGVS